MQTIYLDECGYTGEDLLNDSQPVFVICTHSLSEVECEQIKARHFAEVKARELKHSDLSKRPSQQKMVLSALDELVTRSEQIKVGVSHKRYALTGKIVDLVIETSMHAAGFNLYRNGGDIALTNVIYHCMGLDPEYLDGVLARFQNAMRQRTRQQCKEFIKFIAEPHPIDVVDDFRQRILVALRHVGFEAVFKNLPKNALDLSLSTAFHLVGMWRKGLGDTEIRIVHDRSSNMTKQKTFWDVLVDPNARHAVVGFDTRTKIFPLSVNETVFEQSHQSAALQIADLIAGSVAQYMGARIKGAYGDYEKRLERVFERGIGGYVFWPSWEVTPEGMGTLGPGGENPLDYIAERLLTLKRGKKNHGG